MSELQDPSGASQTSMKPGQDRDVLAEALPYVVPYAAFGVLTMAADYLPEAWRSAIYLVKVLVVGYLLWHYRRSYTEVSVRWSSPLVVAALVGVLVIVAWVGLDPYYPQSGDEWKTLQQTGLQRFEHADKLASAFDPFAEGSLVPPPVALLFRLLGAVLLVPVFEELFWRSWLIRFLVKDNFAAVPIGRFTWLSFAATVAFFGLTHHEWLAALLCGAAFNLLLYWRRDLFTCIVAHAVANAALAAWVLLQGAWQFW